MSAIERGDICEFLTADDAAEIEALNPPPARLLQDKFKRVPERVQLEARWIPATTLPESGKRVLVYVPPLESDEPDAGPPILFGWYDGKCWRISGLKNSYYVSHWQPLPEAP